MTFSFDAGKKWYRMRNAEQLDFNWEHIQVIDDSVYALHVKSKTWYTVDTAQRVLTPSSLDGSYCRFAILSSGAGLAIRHVSGDEVELRYRQAGTGTWEPLPELRDSTGAVVNVTRSLRGRFANLLRASPQRAVFFLDSGRVLEFDGDRFQIRALLPSTWVSTLLLSARFVRSDSVVRVIYKVARPESNPPRTYFTYSVVDYMLPTGDFVVTEAGRSIPRDVVAGGILFDGPRFRQIGSTVTRAAVQAAFDTEDNANRPRVVSVGMAGDLPFGVVATGEIYGVTDPEAFPARLSVSSPASAPDLKARVATLRVTPIGTADGEVIVPGGFVTKGGTNIDVYTSEQVFKGSLPATCAHVRDNGELLIGSYDIARKSEGMWSLITIPRELRDSGVAVSSITTIKPSTLLVGLRASRVGSSLTESWVPRKGGLIVSTDNGATWNSVPLPQSEQWVESVTRSPNGDIYCWATNMVIDSAYGGGIDPQPRHGSARLYRTTDLGLSWSTLYVDEVDEVERRAAALHQWSISFSSNGAIAINTPLEVLTAAKVGEAFTPVLDLPPAAKIGGVVFDQAGDLWIGTSYGLHRRSLNPSSISDDETASQLSEALYALHAQPNPVTDNVVFTLTSSLSAATLPDFITLSSINGATTVRIPRSGSTYELSTVALPAGVYTASAHIGANVVSTMIVIL